MTLIWRQVGACTTSLAALAAAHAADGDGSTKAPPAAPATAAATATAPTAPQASTPAPSQVTITGKAQPQQTLIDRKVYKVSAELNAGTASAADVLNTVPSVEVDLDGNLSLRGDRKVLVLIDGKPSAQLSGSGAGEGLLQLPASMIDRIEVMTTPPAQYRAEGTGGVINIVTKKAKAGGSASAVQASVGNRLRYGLGASGSFTDGDLSLSGGAALRRDERRRIVDTTLLTPDGSSNGQTSATQNFDERARRLLPSLRGSLSWQASPTQTWEADLNARVRNGERFFDQANDTHAADGSLTRSTTRHSDGHESVLATDQTLRWRWAAEDKTSTLDLSWHRSADVEREHYAYVNRSTAPSPGTSTDHLSIAHDLDTVDWALDASHTLANGAQVKLGLALTQDRHAFFNAGDTVDAASGQPVPNPNITNRFEHRGDVQAVYASWQHSLAWATLVAGLRLERTRTDGWQMTTGERHHQAFSGSYPSLRAEHWLDAKTSLSLGYGKRVSRPDPESLNPFIDYQDIHNLRAGNPLLRPQQTQALEARWRHEAGPWNIDLTGYARRHRDSVTDILQVLSADVTLATKANLPHNRTRGLEFSADGQANAHWGYRVSGNAYSSEIDATALGTPGLKSTTGLNLKATLDYKPDAADAVQLQVNHVGRRLTPQGSVEPNTVANLGWRHTLDGQTNLVATLSDAFNTQRVSRQLTTAALTQSYQRQQLGRSFFIGVNHVLGGGPKKGKAGTFDYEQ